MRDLMKNNEMELVRDLATKVATAVVQASGRTWVGETSIAAAQKVLHRELVETLMKVGEVAAQGIEDDVLGVRVSFDITMGDPMVDPNELAEAMFDFLRGDPDELFPEIESVDGFHVEVGAP